MNRRIQAFEARLRKGVQALDRMEAEGRSDAAYERTLRHWLQLLAAYEYEVEARYESEAPALAAV